MGKVIEKVNELVAALRCGEYKPECGASDCLYWSGLGCMDGQLMTDAADAIEALQAQLPKRGEIVRCGECKFSDWYESVDGEQLCYCMKHGSTRHKETDYCNYGEREAQE